VSPVVAGLIFVLRLRAYRLARSVFIENDMKIVFAVPGNRSGDHFS
jgi:ABC-type sulfate transport system permease subunit